MPPCSRLARLRYDEADSGGIWLDHGELEQIIEASEQKPGEKRDGVLRNFLEMLRPKV